jgi:hypothetical protein
VFDHEDRELLKELLRMTTANDEALAVLQANYATLAADVATLISLIPTGDGSDDISAGVNAVAADLATLDATVKAATPTAPAPTVEALTYTPAATVDTALGAPADFTLGTVTGGTAPYTYAVTGLPDGLTEADGTITGTPTATGTSTLDVTVTDSAGATATGTVTLTVA